MLTVSVLRSSVIFLPGTVLLFFVWTAGYLILKMAIGELLAIGNAVADTSNADGFLGAGNRSHEEYPGDVRQEMVQRVWSTLILRRGPKRSQARRA